MKTLLTSLFLAAVAFSAAGCTVHLRDDSFDPAPMPEPAYEDRGLPSMSPFEAGQVWLGGYYCEQGDTDLALVVQQAEGNFVLAEFQFESPDGTRGDFYVGGEWDDYESRMVFEPGPWIDAPPFYVTVGMDGNVGGATFDGTILGPGCSDFSVTLAQ